MMLMDALSIDRRPKDALGRRKTRWKVGETMHRAFGRAGSVGSAMEVLSAVDACEDSRLRARCQQAIALLLRTFDLYG